MRPKIPELRMLQRIKLILGDTDMSFHYLRIGVLEEYDQNNQ